MALIPKWRSVVSSFMFVRGVVSYELKHTDKHSLTHRLNYALSFKSRKVQTNLIKKEQINEKHKEQINW